jgi:DNA-binding NarL/FixJ family response regulator
LVGRSAELARIGAALERAAAGRGGVLTVAGMSGIGKTRLLDESVALARGRGFAVMAGAAGVLGGSQAYSMWLAALAPYLAGRTVPDRARLVDGLPDLGRLLTGLHLPPPAALLDAGLERTRLFEAVARLLARVAERGPLLVALDDLHWADPASVQLLHYVARGVPDRRMVLVTAYRTDEADRSPDLSVLVRDLRRGGRLEEVRLTGLDPAATRSLAQNLLGGDPPEEFVASVTARTVGSPLLIAALIDELRATGGLFRSGGSWVVGAGALDLVPPVVGDLVRGRLHRLTGRQRALLELVAVAGEAADAPVLADALEVAEDDIAVIAGELADLAMIAEVSDDAGVRYQATHPVYAEVAYRELPESVRRRRHAAVAAALERRCPYRIELLAPHYLGGRDRMDPDRALVVLAAAGERALAVQAGAEAAGYLSAARRLAAAAGDRRRMTELGELLGDAWQAAGRADAAVPAWTEALAGYRELSDTEAVARVARHLAPALLERGEFEPAARLLDEVLTAPEPADPASELVLLRETRILLLARTNDIAAIEASVADLGAVGARLGSPRAVAAADLYCAELHRLRGEYATARRMLRDVLATAERLGDPVFVGTVQRHLIIVDIGWAGPGPARVRARHTLVLARAAAIPALEVAPRLMLCFVSFLAGDWDDAWQYGTGLLSLGHRVGSSRAVAAGLAGRSLVLCHRGDLAGAAQCLAEARATFGAGRPTDRHVFGLVDMVESMVALQRDAAPAHPGSADLPAVGLPLPELRLAVLAQTLLAAGDVDAALAVSDRVVQLGPRAPYPAALGGRVAGLAHRARGDLAAARSAAAGAAAVFIELGMPFEAARCRLDRARAVGDEDPADAVAGLQEALRCFAGLGARRYADQARRLLRELGAQPVPGPRRPAAGLSAREIEVVRLVAEGLSNAEIARRLVISPRTVTTHLQHVYARLGLGSRTALVRYALDRDLFRTTIRTAGRPDT